MDDRMSPAAAPRSLTWSVGWTMIGTASYLATQYLQVVAVTKLGRPGMVADFTLGVAIVLPIIALSQMQLRQLCVTDSRHEHPFREYLAHRLLASLGAFFVTAAVTWIIRASGEFTGLLFMLTAQRLMESLSDITHAEWQRHERLDLVAASLTTRSLISLGVFVTSLWSGSTLTAAIGGMLIISLLTFALWDLPGVWCSSRRLVGTHSVTTTGLWRLSVVAMPLGLITAIQVGATYMPRYLLEGIVGSDDMAFYSIAATPLSLLTPFVAAVSQSALARTAASLQRGDYDGFRQLTMKLTWLYGGINGLGALVFWLGGPWILELMFTPEYRVAAPATQVIMLGVLIGSLSAFGSSVLVATRSNWLQFGNTVAGIAVQVLLCLVLAPRYGFLGAAWAECGRYVACTAFLWYTGSVVYSTRRREHGVREDGAPMTSKVAA